MTHTPAAHLVQSDIVHVRHGSPSHRLSRRGLSIWLDLQRLNEADTASTFFSVNKFNLLSFHEADFGCNHAAFRNQRFDKNITPLTQYVESQILKQFPDAQIESIHILAFPRILGLAFNPITVYSCACDETGEILMYEVHNTFGDCHTYFAVRKIGDEHFSHDVDKKLHVSPFFNMDGGYRLSFKRKENYLRLLVRYSHDGEARLTATLTGQLLPLTASMIFKQLLKYAHLPMRVWAGIHVEAIKLVLKKCRFHKRPEPQQNPISIAKPSATHQKG